VLRHLEGKEPGKVTRELPSEVVSPWSVGVRVSQPPPTCAADPTRGAALDHAPRSPGIRGDREPSYLRMHFDTKKPLAPRQFGS